MVLEPPLGRVSHQEQYKNRHHSWNPRRNNTAQTCVPMINVNQVTMLALSYLVAFAVTLSLVASHPQPSTVARRSYGPNSQFCKAAPGTADWPSQTTWAQFNQSLGGSLLRPAPPGAVCHPGQPSYNAEQCPITAASWSTYEFHSNDPISR